jgi:hypothetical protein
LVLGLARQYFSDINISNNDVFINQELLLQIAKSHSSIKDYIAYILMDFSLVDLSLEEIPLGWAFQLAEDFGIKDAFDVIVKKELQLSEKKLQQRKQICLSAFQMVKEGESEQIYE